MSGLHTVIKRPVIWGIFKFSERTGSNSLAVAAARERRFPAKLGISRGIKFCTYAQLPSYTVHAHPHHTYDGGDL